ncbi:MAG: hypothetical protein MUF76_08790 [Hydrogenophaga sp.]|jgi:hypothetical protein|nr:hypothetical protein [Hydrogenophaga sp.]
MRWIHRYVLYLGVGAAGLGLVGGVAAQAPVRPVDGLQRELAPAGHVQRFTYVHQGRTVLVMDFHVDGSLSALRCDRQSRVPQDVEPCGHNGAAGEVTLRDASGRATGQLRHRAGQLLFQSVLDGQGRTLRTEEVREGRRIKRVFYPSGQPRSEADFIDRHPGESPGREGVAREWAEGGQLTQETLWILGRERVVRQWYLNGQLKMQQTIEWRGRHQMRLTESYWESGRPAAVNTERNGRMLGWQKYFDESGVLRREEEHGERGALLRRKRYGADGALEQDEQLLLEGERV